MWLRNGLMFSMPSLPCCPSWSCCSSSSCCCCCLPPSAATLPRMHPAPPPPPHPTAPTAALQPPPPPQSPSGSSPAAPPLPAPPQLPPRPPPPPTHTLSAFLFSPGWVCTSNTSNFQPSCRAVKSPVKCKEEEEPKLRTGGQGHRFREAGAL